MNRRPYPVYKPSGIEWLGKIPVGWEIWKVTHAFGRIGSGTTPKSDNYEYYDGQIPWVTTSELRETDIDETLNKLTEEALRDYPTLRLYPVGTLLFAMYGATVGRLGILKISATVNQACAAFSEPIKLDPKFTYYWLYIRRPILIALSAGGGQPNLSQDDLKQLKIPAPSLQEQRIIAAFLDRETTRMDALIKKKQRQIELLREKRTALISRAVTVGLDPNATMKDSGIEWLGEIPAHWEVLHLGYAFRLQAGFAFQSESFTAEGVPIVKMSNLKEGRLDLSDATKIPDDQCMPEFALEVGDLVVGMSGSINNFAVVDETDIPCQLNQRVGRFLQTGLKTTFHPYLQYLVSSVVFMGQMELTASGTAQANISSEEIGHFSIALPPADEQRAIVAYLDRETTRIDALIEKVEKSIDLLREYRTALISAAVTGKIDVRKESS